MNALQEFLIESNVEDIKQEIDIGGRLKGHALTIRPLNGAQYNELQALCMEQRKGGVKSMNVKKFNEQIILRCLINPNLRDTEMINAANVRTPEEVMYKVFLSGEIAAIAENILAISGFGNANEDFEEAKNS